MPDTFFILLLMLAACTCAAERWSASPEGDTLLRPFRNAPYPHPSRAEGWEYNKTSFSAEKHYSDSTVGIFIPKGFRPGATVDLVVHFHGHGNNVAKAMEEFSLREQMLDSGSNAVLIIPQGPKDSIDSGGGHLELDAGAFSDLAGEVAALLKSEGRITSSEIGRIALSAHSGGYKVTSAVLSHGGLSDHITDVLLFDATYASLDGFAGWLAGGKDRRLISIFTKHLAGENVTLMSLLGERKVAFDVFLEAESAGRALSARKAHFIYTTELQHNDVVSKRGYLARWLRSSALSRLTK